MKIAHNQNKELQLKLMTNLILWNQFLQKGKKETNKQTKKKTRTHKNDRHHQTLHTRFPLGTKLHLKQKNLKFCSKFVKKRFVNYLTPSNTNIEF